MIDHDKLFKELLKTFFLEFLELFFAEMCSYLDRDSIEFLDKEFFTDGVTGERREADIVAKVKFRDHEAFFVINIENQGRADANFPERPFFYFAGFLQKLRLPVYPIVVFYGDRPKKPQPDTFQVVFPDHKVLEFHYRVVQLNRLQWRDFLQQKNPVASALMAKMNIAPQERPFVKAECFRLMTGLKLTKAKSYLISGFVDTYLNLTAKEQETFEKEIAKLEPRRRKKVMEFTTSWMRQGIEIGEKRGRAKGEKLGLAKGEKLGLAKGEKLGKQQGALRLALSLLKRQLGQLPQPLQSRVEKLSLAQLEALSLALLDFSSVEDLTAWFKKNPRSKKSDEGI